MRLSGVGAENRLFHAAAINQKMNGQNPENAAQGGLLIGQRNRDALFLSGQGKKESIIQQLMNQKQLIQESKNAEMERGLEEGYVNQDKIDEYDEQLKMLDEQIAKAMTDQEETDGEEKDAGISGNANKAGEDDGQRKMAALMNISAQVEQAETVSSAKMKMEGEARVLRAEIKSDGSGALESKKERVSEIEARSSGLAERIGDKIADAHATLTESRDDAPKEADAEEDE